MGHESLEARRARCPRKVLQRVIAWSRSLRGMVIGYDSLEPRPVGDVIGCQSLESRPTGHAIGWDNLGGGRPRCPRNVPQRVIGWSRSL